MRFGNSGDKSEMSGGRPMDIQEDFAVRQRITLADTRNAMRSALSTGRCERADVADILCVSVRTLQRHLARTGYNFISLRDELRRELVREYLANPHLTFRQIADKLGLGEKTTLWRSCRRWFGATPGTLRGQCVDANQSEEKDSLPSSDLST